MKTFELRTWPAMAAVAALLSVVPADAYNMIQATSTGRVTSGNAVSCYASGGFAHWHRDTYDNIQWRLNDAGQGWDKAGAVQAAANTWTGVADADHRLVYAGTTTAGWATDGQNTVLFATGNGCTGSCLALTALVMQAGQEIVESDITFNANYTWRTNGADSDTQAVMAHEFGHSLGIHHSTASGQPTMQATYFGTGGRSLTNDDRSALQCSHRRYGNLDANLECEDLGHKYFCDVTATGGAGGYSYSWGASYGATIIWSSGSHARVNYSCTGSSYATVHVTVTDSDGDSKFVYDDIYCSGGGGHPF